MQYLIIIAEMFLRYGGPDWAKLKAAFGVKEDAEFDAKVIALGLDRPKTAAKLLEEEKNGG
jgi:hypothetical protein